MISRFRGLLPALAIFLWPALLTAQTAPPVEDSERGCLEGRVLDYLQRHGDHGTIDPLVMLERSREIQHQMDFERLRNKTSNSIGGSVWTSLGPTNGAGRATAIAVDPASANNIIIGAAGGGAWKTTDGGANWSPLTDSIPNLSVGAISLAPSLTSTIYLGTGEGGYAGDFIPGIGLLVSTNSGVDWTLPSTVIATEFYKMSVHPTTPSELVVATNRGAMRSTAGQNGPWATVIAHDSAVATTGYGDVTDLVRDPSNPLILYASTWDTGYWCARYGCSNPTNFVSSTVLKSIDGGQTWSPANSGLPVSTSNIRVSRIALAIAPSSPSTLYAATSLYDATLGTYTAHIYKTTNGGGLWSDTTLSANADTRISRYFVSAGDQSSYDNTIIVSPTDPNTVVAGGVYYVRTVDGGTTWNRAFQSGVVGVHVDAHELRYAGTALYVANDGGIYSSTDDGQSATDRNATLVTRQYYTLTNDPANRNRIFGGMQDNGTNRRPDAGGTSWTTMTGGDGFGCALVRTVPSIVFTSFQYESLNRTSGGGDATPNFMGVAPLFPAGEGTPFSTTIVNSPNSPQTLYTGSTRLWKTSDAGDSWTPLPITTTDGSTWTSAAGSEIGSIAISRSNPSILMVAKGYYSPDFSYHSAIFRSTDGGQTWVLANTGLPVKYPTYLDIDPANSNIAYVTLAGTTGSSLYKTINGGTSWTASATGLPAFSAQVVRVDPTDSNTIYCGTDVGVYRSTDQGANWSRFGTGMPAVSVYDLRALDDGSILRAVTHGRGVWDLTVTGVTNHPPLASIGTPATPTYTATKGSPVSFAGTVSDPDGGDSATPLWTFPDSWTTSSSTSSSHTFNRAGVFPVTLLATDTFGATAASVVKVTVTESGDACSAAVTVPPSGPFPWSASFITDAATVQTSDPGGGGATGPAACYPYLPYTTLWLSFTPSASGTYDFYTCGSKVATVVELWTGAACGPYTAVSTACLVNFSPLSNCGSDTKLSVALTAGTTYRILLMGYFNQGPATLTVAQGAIGTVASGISPAMGSSSGGTPVVITGSGFAGPTTVTIGGVAATGVTVVSSNLLTATSGAHVAGVTDVAVTSGGTTGTLTSAYTYIASVVLSAPANLVAGASSTTTAGLTWSSVVNADHYEVARSSNNGAYATIATPSGATFGDSGLTAGTAYLYKVRAIGPSGETSPYSNVDVATTIVFTDDPLQAGVTVVKAVHVNEVRTAINAMRAAAGQGAYSFAATITGGTTVISASHLLELRTVLDAVRLTLAQGALSYSHTITAGTTAVSAVDITEIRNGVK
jgi:photosystem II stability/assembly factor-like uncharacterized protein